MRSRDPCALRRICIGSFFSASSLQPWTQVCGAPRQRDEPEAEDPACARFSSRSIRDVVADRHARLGKATPSCDIPCLRTLAVDFFYGVGSTIISQLPLA